MGKCVKINGAVICRSLCHGTEVLTGNEVGEVLRSNMVLLIDIINIPLRTCGKGIYPRH